MKTYFPNFKNKKILILGLGLLGRGLGDTIFFVNRGARVRVTDLKTAEALAPTLLKLKKYPEITYTLGRHDERDIDWADLIIRNADIPTNSPFLRYARKKKKLIEMDDSLFAKYCPCPIIGITGTRGKSTTTALIFELAKATGRRVWLTGNGVATASLNLIDKVKPGDLVISELSSWQLNGYGEDKISPHIAVFTNIFPDHLNRYNGMDDYINDKKEIFRHQKKSDYLVINAENPAIKSLGREAPSQVVWFSKKQIPQNWKIKVLGDHNRENIAAAIAVAKILKVPDNLIKKIVANFRGIPNRLEYLRTIRGVDFYNDTTSTTPIAGQMALAAIDRPIILIAGGATKKLDLAPFARDIAKKVKKVILLEGSATTELESKIRRRGGAKKILARLKNLRDAVKLAQATATRHDVVLLSPGCASFGLFKNEFDRGDQFKKIVKNLK